MSLYSCGDVFECETSDCDECSGVYISGSDRESV